jgi:hypothetical protein
LLVLACSSTSSPGGPTSPGGTGGTAQAGAGPTSGGPSSGGAAAGGAKEASGGDASGTTGSGGDTSTGGTIFTFPATGGTGEPDSGTPAPCDNAANADGDHDGFSIAQGDCNDCDPNTNPGAYDVPKNGLDEDCSGKADDEASECDATLAIDSMDASDAAKAVGVCRRQQGATWGLVSAAWVFPDGTTAGIESLAGCPKTSPPNPLSHGILATFGDELVPREGKAMVAISTGMARAGVLDVPPPGFGTSPETGRMCTASNPPPGFPEASPTCPGVTPHAGLIYDAMALELKIKVPSNAHAVEFDFDFLTTEFPRYVCSPDGYNDQFVALLWSTHPQTPPTHDISFDAKGNDVNVNNGYLDECTPVTRGGKAFPCTLGADELRGTGMSASKQDDQGTYVQGGSTSWLQTKAAVVPGEVITVRFGIWDAGDNQFDSTALLDRLTWDLSGGATPPPPKPPVTMRPPKLE